MERQGRHPIAWLTLIVGAAVLMESVLAYLMAN